MSDRKYNPQERLEKSLAGRERTLQPGRVAWVRLDWLDVIQSRLAAVGSDPADRTDPADMEEYGVDHTLSIFAVRGRGGISMNLSGFTAPELDAFKELIDRVFAEARTECERRDALAQEAYENGEDSFQRLYRAVPRVVYRKGEKPPHSSGVHSGPPGLAGEDGGD